MNHTHILLRNGSYGLSKCMHRFLTETIGLSQNRVSEIIGNTNFGNIDNLLSQGRSMEYIARHYNMDLPLVWALRLEGKTDQGKFKELGWGLRTWDQWNFNEFVGFARFAMISVR